MRIISLEIKGFGSLAQKRLDLDPGFNLFYGPNEAGKSTLQKAILALLYGFYSSNRAKPGEKKEQERYRPWRGGAYWGRLRYRLRGGKEVEVTRDFSSPDLPTLLRDPLTGRDLTHQFKSGRHGNIPFAQEHLGMDREIFEASAFVRQAQVRELRDSSHIIDQVTSLLDTGSLNMTAKKAIGNLQEKLSEIGGERAQKAKLPLLLRRLNSLKLEREALEEAKNSLRKDLERREELEVKLLTLQGEIEEAEHHLLLRKSEEIRARLHSLQEATERIKELDKEATPYKPYAQFPSHLKETFLRHQQDLLNQREKVKELGERLEREREGLRKLEDDLKGYKDIAGIDLERLQRLGVRWEMLDQNYKEGREKLALLREGFTGDEEVLSKLTPEEVEEVKAVEDDLSQVTQRLGRPIWRWRWLGLGLAVLSLGLGFSPVLPLSWGGGGLVIFLGLWLWAQLRLYHLKAKAEVAREELETRLSPFGVNSYQELAEAKDKFRDYLTFRQTLIQVERSKEEEEGELLAMLDRVGIEEVTPRAISQAEERILEYQGRKREEQEAKKRIGELENSLAQAIARTEAAEASLRELLSQGRIWEEDLEKGQAAFQRGLDYKERWDKICNLREKEEAKVKGILSLSSQGQLEEELNELTHRLSELEVRNPKLKGTLPQGELKEIQSSLQELKAQREMGEKELERLKERIANRLRGYRPLSEIEEEIAQVEGDVASLKRFRRCLLKAKETIAEVSDTYHRSLVPFLNQRVSEGIRRISGGRYGEVMVDPQDLRLKLKVPEREGPTSAENLSLGTQEQLYFLLRLAIVQLLSQSREKVPIILDDPFVHFDRARLEAVLQLLWALAEENQILLFTKDELIRDWLRGRGGRVFDLAT